MRPFSHLMFALVVILAAPKPASATAELAQLAEGTHAYRAGAYDKAIELLTPLLYPQIRLPTQADALKTHKLLGISYLFVDDQAAAKKEFSAILAQRPDYRFEPLADPVVAVELFEQVKRENAEDMAQILEQSRIDEERRASEGREEARRRAKREQLSRQIVERTIVEKPYWINYVPFGAGQFQNGHKTKGFVLLGAQAFLGALSISTALWLRLNYSDGRVPSSEWDSAQALRWTQVISGGLCLATMLYGIVDALYYWEPATVKTRKYEKPIAARTTVIPLLGQDAVGLAWGGAF